MRQVVNAPVRNPRHAGTDEGDRSLVGGKGSVVVRAPRRRRAAASQRQSESRRDRVSVSVTRSLSPRSPRSLLQLHVPSSFPVFERPASTFGFFVPSFSSPPCPGGGTFAFPARSHCPSAFPFFFFPPFPSLSTASSRRRPAGFTPANRFNLTYVSLERARF